MSPEKVVKYSVPFFVMAIISRSIEEISFIYYAVPVMCVFFIVLLFKSSKSNSLPRTCLTAKQVYFGVKSLKSKDQNRDPSTSLRMTNPKEGTIRYSVFGIPVFIPFLILLPGLWFLLTSLWSSYPEISAVRALYYILISLGCISAGILWVQHSKKNIFDFLLPANLIVVLLCLFSLITNIPSDSWTAGHGKGFMGFFGHQNLLASVLLSTLPSVLYCVVILAKSRIGNIESLDSRRTSFAGMTVKSDSSFRRSPESEIPSDYLLLTTNYLPLTAYSLLLTANLLVVALTYSRSAIVALIFGVIVFLILNKNWKVILYGVSAALMLVIVIKFTPPLNQFTNTIIKKDFPEVYSSRMWMWEPSYKAALAGGLFGLGYGISHPEIRSGEYSDRYENGRLIREKGNSSLALVEETGLVGLILFLIPIFYVMNKCRIYNLEFRMRPFDKLRVTDNSLLTTHYSLLTAALAAFILHAQFEAWWVGVGSVQLPLFYIYFGLIVLSLKSNV